MTHYSENSKSLVVNQTEVFSCDEITKYLALFSDVCLIILPSDTKSSNEFLFHTIASACNLLGKSATLIILGTPTNLVKIQSSLRMPYQIWISIKRKTIQYNDEKRSLPNHHFGALIHTKYHGALKHTVTRIQYTYCPSCDKTTKDYGGKKHTYNSYGTLISDVWRDMACDLEGDLSEAIQRFADLFGLENYRELRVLDCRNFIPSVRQVSEARNTIYNPQLSLFHKSSFKELGSHLINGDCLDELKQLPSNSVDFAFIDPPYNLGKIYNNYLDNLSVQEYFLWCDQWIAEILRTLRPGRTLAILNIPLWAIRHFIFMQRNMEFQNWITWDALSFPVRKIMPSHYAVVCFSKGRSRSLPGLINTSGNFINNFTSSPLHPLAEQYCLRASCVRERSVLGQSDRGMLTDLWWDIHRLKHNSRRVDHLCQLPPQLMYRLISIFTEPGELVLDCFNGTGTTTLSAHQLERRYIGIEISDKYHHIAEARHEEIRKGLNPFRKDDRQLTEKNSRVPRRPQQTYEISKKDLQLEIRRIANQLNKIPSREDVINYGKYSIRYYDEYFTSWGEACAAARHDGMSETRMRNQADDTIVNTQQLDLFAKSTDTKPCS